MKRVFCFTVLLIVFLTAVSSGSAITRKEVLGAEDNSLSIPPTIEGPGYVLPDSPFYFLDKVKQSIRVIFAFSQEARAKIYANIAGERMAELRFMLLKQNENAARASLSGISEAFENAQKQLESAKIAGRDISKLAKEINDSIKAKQEVLDDLGVKTTGEMGKQIQATAEGLTESKIRIEEYLSLEDLANEINYDVNRELELRLYDASTSAKALEAALEDLKEQREQAIEQSLKNREEALDTAIEQQSEAIRRQEQLVLQQERKAFEKNLLLEEEAIEQVSTNVAKAQAAAVRYQSLQKTNQ